MKQLTLGSLFDGSGGFPLGAALYGATPLWASEIEPFAIRVTTKRFPRMQHLGDIANIHGGAIPPVDIITFGSPCTDLSIAGKRDGLDGEQSSLFYEAIRIIQQMREATNGQYPRFIIFENVQGAFNSNRGADFKAILDAIIQIAEPDAKVPPTDKGGWPYADILVGSGWSVAYRLIDAQYFGVAQRRKRVYLVADFGSERAGEILFEREGVCRDFTPGKSPWERTAGDIAGDVGTANGTDYLTGWDNQRFRVATGKGICPTVDVKGGGGACGVNILAVHQNQAGELRTGDVANTLSTNGNTTGRNAPLVAAFMAGQGAKAGGIAYSESVSPTLKGSPSGLNQSPCAIVYGISSYESNAMKSGNPHSGIYEAETARTLDSGGGNPSCNQGGIAVCMQGSMIGRADKNGPQGDGINEGISFTLNTIDRHAVAYSLDRAAYNQGQNAQYNISISEEQAQTLVARGPHAVAKPSGVGYIVRRLTPQECAQLQGFARDFCAGLETPEPSETDISFWSEVWETHRRVIGKSTKPKTRNQIIKWLRQPHSDSAEYKLWGNGVSLPCVCFVMAGIREVVGN